MSEQVKSKLSIARTKHGHAKPMTPTYKTWRSMKYRVNDPGYHNSRLYIGKGIKICDRWQKFENFLEDMGERPEGCTLDRWPNKEGDYEPGNCRWATPREQARNTSRNVLDFEKAVQIALMRLNGVACKAIADQFGISPNIPREIGLGRCWPDALEAAIKIKEGQHD